MLAFPATSSPPVLEFKGSPLGMPLAAWRGAPFPGATADVRPVCASDGAGAGRQASPIPTAGANASDLVCTYAFAGPSGLRVPVPIGDGFYARRIRYVFRAGRLSEISFMTSPNAFDAMVARVDAQIGPARQTTRDTARVFDRTLPRVRMRWPSPAGVVTLVDPAAQTGLIAMDYAAVAAVPLGSAARSPEAQPPG